jgi:hypothetical protein
MCHEYCPSPMGHEYSSFRCDILLLHHFVSFCLYFLLANTKDFSPSVDSDVQHLGTGLAYPALWCWACLFRHLVRRLQSIPGGPSYWSGFAKTPEPAQVTLAIRMYILTAGLLQTSAFLSCPLQHSPLFAIYKETT